MTIFDDEIDLRPYIYALLRNWWLILLLAILATSVVYYSGIRQPRLYTSAATLLVTHSRPNLLLADRFPTVTESYDIRTRMEAFLAIAQSDTLALDTIKALGNTLPPNERQLDAFKSRVVVTNSGDLIRISATASNSQLAAEIANAWAHQAAQAINQAYSGELPLPDIQAQLLASQQEYETAQAELQTYIQTSQIYALENRLAEAKALFSNMNNDRAWQYTYYFQRKQAMEDLRVQAEALKQQLNSSDKSAAASLGDAIAVLRTRANAFEFTRFSQDIRTETSEDPRPVIVPNPGSNFTLNFQLPDISSIEDSNNIYNQDLDQLIQQAQDEQIKAEENLLKLTQDVTLSQGYEFVQETAAQIQLMESQLEQERARQRELNSKRDLAWNAYQALAQKEVEIRNSSQTSLLVNLANPAIPSQNPAPLGTRNRAIMAGVLGMMTGILLVLAVQWWRLFSQPKAISPISSIDLASK